MTFTVTVLFTCIIHCDAGPELFASTADNFFSRVSYLPSNVFVRRRRRFTSRKLYACLGKFLCFLQLSDRAQFLELDVWRLFLL